jgi:protein-S-isoprenylcysteine O-methyltransferase Ste14
MNSLIVIRIDNLWLIYVIVYAIGLSMQEWANHKRGEPFDDPEFLFRGKKIFILAITWILSGFILSLFIPINFGLPFYLGLFFLVCGMVILVLTTYSFAYHQGLVKSGIHCYSRNPIYVSWTIVIFSLCLFGWSNSIWSILFWAYFVITIPYFHWTVLLEEDFLIKKYGNSYQEYLSKVPRYFGITKKTSN